MRDRVALVTGASRGIGFATAARLAENGFHLVLHGHRAEAVEQVAATLAEKYGVTVLTGHGDIGDPATSMARMQVACSGL